VVRRTVLATGPGSSEPSVGDVSILPEWGTSDRLRSGPLFVHVALVQPMHGRCFGCCSTDWAWRTPRPAGCGSSHRPSASRSRKVGRRHWTWRRRASTAIGKHTAKKTTFDIVCL
jgi:hypothetical protein